MLKLVNDDMREEILVRLDAENLIRCKSVCKSWNSLISQPRFVQAHHKTQVKMIPYRMGIAPSYLSKFGTKHYMVGSANGLACINSCDGNEIIVANPWTREERVLHKLPVSQVRSCWGFGYDALTDDYKVVFGAVEVGKTTFHVLSLKSNVWKHVEHVNYICYGDVQIGALCNGGLQWVMHSGNKHHRLISFDLSTEVLKVIHQSEKEIPECSLLAIEKRNVCIYVDYNESGKELYSYELYWKKSLCRSRCNFYTLSITVKNHYAFIPSTVMSSLISPYLQEELLRENKRRMIDKSIGEIDREIQGLRTQESKLIAEIKEIAKQGQLGDVKIMAKKLIGTRHQIKQFYNVKSQLQSVSLLIQTSNSTQATGEAMKAVAKAMGQVNRHTNLPSLQKTMREFEMEMVTEVMGDVIDDALEGDEEEDETVSQVLNEIGIDINHLMSAPSGVVSVLAGKTKVPQAEAPASDDEY